LRRRESGGPSIAAAKALSSISAILATLPPLAADAADAQTTRAYWEAWQAGLVVRPTLLAELPPLRLLLVLDNLTGHKSPDLVCRLFQHGVMPLYTPLWVVPG